MSKKEATASATVKTQRLTFKKSTKGTHVYEELVPGKGEIASQIYISRSAIQGEPPKGIKITMEADV